MPAVQSSAEGAASYEVETESDTVATAARELHRRYLEAPSDKRLAALLTPLEGQGFTVLPNRLWPDSQSANIDFVIVGPSGVLIIDAKSWGDVSLRDNHVFQGQADVTDRFENLHNLADVAQVSLAEIGMAPGEIRVVAVFMGKSRLHGYVGGVDLIGEDELLDYVLNRGARLRPSEVDAARTLVEQLFKPIYLTGPRLSGRRDSGGAHSGGRVGPEGRIETPTETLPLTEPAIAAALRAFSTAAPIEDWMTFLSPDQARLARRSFNGPSRIRGAAGTGKTVVGLHRAAYLARHNPGKVLVTSLVRTLPAVMEQLMERMAPDVADRIEFTGIHAFALDLLRARGVRVHLNAKGADRAFDKAWDELGRSSMLATIDPHDDYWHEEVISVIKGRGITSFDDYARLARVGRRRGLSTEARRIVWELYAEYDLALREAAINDFADLILLAEKSLRQHPLEGYSSVIADEAQDLSCAMIRMLHAIVGDRTDGLNLIGDGQQTIYPGGYTLAEADVSIAGRGVVMTTNYRNTSEIADFASAMVRGDEFTDIEGGVSAQDVAASLRSGARPRVSRFNSRAGHDRSLVAQVAGLIGGGTSGGDIAVLTQTNFVASEVLAALAAAGIPAMSLVDYDGSASSSVKVGTIKRAKGLEFRQVLVARASASLLETAWSSTDEAEAERRELDRRELYVAMTRARDGLWVGVA